MLASYEVVNIKRLFIKFILITKPTKEGNKMKKAFVKFLESKDYSELKTLWNEYASDQNMDDYIYDGVEEYCDLYDPKAVDVARMVAFGDIKNWGDDAYLNGYGNFKSCWSIESSPIDLEVLAEWLEEENHSSYEEWEDDLQPFGDWLNDSYNRAELIAMWEEYTGDDTDDFDLEILADKIEEVEGEEYLDYIKMVKE